MLSATAIQKYLRCPQAYDYRYNDRIVAIERSPALDMGSGVHAGLEVIKAGGEDYIQAVHGHLQYVSPQQALSAELMTTAWKGRYANDGLEYIKNEFAWKVNLEGVDIQGVFDGIVRLPSGELALIEHKTTGSDISPSSYYWNRLIINVQVDLYNLVAKALGFEISHIIYDVIKLPKLKLQKATLNPKYYIKGSKDGKYGPGDLKPNQRLTRESMPEYATRLQGHIIENVNDLLIRQQIFRTERDEEKTRRDIKLVDKLIRTGHFPRNPGSCYFGRFACDYLPVCSNETSLSNPNLYQIRTR